MNPKHLETYIEGVHKTLANKLFFTSILDKNFFNNKIVIDFGCGDGSVLKYIDSTNPESILVAIDINPNMINLVRENCPSAVTFPSLKAASSWIKTFQKTLKERMEVVCIATSVLHEIGEEQQAFYAFCKENVDYLIVRDMCVTPREDGFIVPLMAKLVANAHPKYFSDFISRYGFIKQALIHFLLKYTYVENWDTEIKENYLSVNWDLIDSLKAESIYDVKYVQEWRKQQVQKDFDIDISEYTDSTHRELIFKVKRKD